MAISKSRFAFFLATEGRLDAIKDRFASLNNARSNMQRKPDVLQTC
jgi:hypothetical protein